MRGVAESSRRGEEGEGHRDYASYLAPALGKGLVGEDEVRVPEPETEPEAGTPRGTIVMGLGTGPECWPRMWWT